MSRLRVRAGDELSAEKWNRIVDALPVQQQGGGAKLPPWPIAQVLVQNNSGTDVDLGWPLVLGDYTGPNDPLLCRGHISFGGNDFDVWPDHVRDIVIAAESIPNGKFGACWVKGLAVARVKVNNPDHGWIRYANSTLDPIQTGDSGQAKILRIFGDDSGEKYALVNLDIDKPTLLCKPLGRIRKQSWGTAREYRYTEGVGWQLTGEKVRCYNVASYTLLPSMKVLCHWHEDPAAYLAIGSRCCDESSSSSSSGSSSSGSSSSSDSSKSSSDSSTVSSSSDKSDSSRSSDSSTSHDSSSESLSSISVSSSSLSVSSASTGPSQSSSMSESYSFQSSSSIASSAFSESSVSSVSVSSDSSLVSSHDSSSAQSSSDQSSAQSSDQSSASPDSTSVSVSSDSSLVSSHDSSNQSSDDSNDSSQSDQSQSDFSFSFSVPSHSDANSSDSQESASEQSESADSRSETSETSEPQSEISETSEPESETSEPPSIDDSTSLASFTSDGSLISQSDGSGDSVDSGGSGDTSGDSGDSGSDGQSDKSTAIVPASFTPGGYAALYTLEAPEVRFDDCMTVPLFAGQTENTFTIDPHYVEVCEPGSIAVSGAVPDVPVVVGASVVSGCWLRVRLASPACEQVAVSIRLTGIRKGFAGKRFGNRTREQFLANEQHIQSAYPGAGQ